MTDELLDRVFSEFGTFLLNRPDQEVSFTWHGGEPMLMGVPFFRKVNARQRAIFGDLLPRVKNQLQSNLTLLTGELLEELLRLPRNGKGIGTSFDVVPDIRLLAGGKSYDAEWFRAAELAQAHGMKMGLGYVVHRQSLGKERELYYFCKNLGPLRASLRANPLHVVGRGASRHSQDLHVTQEEYSQFINTLYDIWEEDGRGIDIEPVKEWTFAMEGLSSNQVCESTGTCHESHIGIAPGGDVYNCGRASDAKILHYGNLLDTSLDEILERRKATVLPLRSQNLRESDSECADCECWDWCHGGCPVDGHVYSDDLAAKSPTCTARKMFFEHYHSRKGHTSMSAGGHSRTTLARGSTGICRSHAT